MRKFKIRDIGTGNILYWSIADMVGEINRDRADGWSDYEEADWEEGWFAWVDGVCLELLEEIYE
tara:strand:+ start:2492 stop:2683 length:192 start_codon:yes stop_codon:yes gene_type:complete